MLQRARWAVEGETSYQKWNNESGGIIECSGYDDFKKKYLQKVENGSNIDIIEGGKYKKLTAEKEYEALAKTQVVSQAESEQIWSRDDGKLGYIQANKNYSNINGYLRGNIRTLSPDNQRTVATLDNLTNSNSLPDNYIGIRKVSAEYLSDVLGVEGFNDFDSNSVKDAVDSIKKMIGTEIEDQAFTSISLIEDRNYFKDRPIKFTIKAPKGTKGLVTNNTEESEFIVARNSKLKIIDAESYKPSKLGKRTYVNIIAEIIQ